MQKKRKSCYDDNNVFKSVIIELVIRNSNILIILAKWLNYVSIIFFRNFPVFRNIVTGPTLSYIT